MHHNTSVLGRLFWQGVQEGFTRDTLMLAKIWSTSNGDLLVWRHMARYRYVPIPGVRVPVTPFLYRWAYDTYYTPSCAMQQLFSTRLTAEDFL